MSPNLSVDFKCITGENRGIYYEASKRALVFLGMHESLDDILKTIDHEVLHHCFADNGENEDMDEDQEERLIYCMQWAGESLA